MLIVSKYRDYYDTSNFGMVDKTIVYNRNETTEKMIDKFSDIHVNKHYTRDRSKTLHFFLLGFCGKYYVGAKFIDNGFTEVIYDLDRIIDRRTNQFEKARWKNAFKWTIERYTNLYNKYNGIEDMEIFRKYNVPSFIIEFDEFRLNPVLKDYDFFRIFNSVETFQNIQSFISGVLTNPEKDMINISDKDKILQHGYDYKWSFRKESKNPK